MEARDAASANCQFVRPAGQRPGEGGFTLVEILVVIAIIALLVAIVVPGYNVMSAQNRRNTCAANLKAIGQALALFREDYQCFPPDVTEHLTLPADPDGLKQEPLPADAVRAAYNPQTGEPINTGLRGRGLYTLYYLGAYSAVLPPTSLEPEARLGSTLRLQIASRREGLNAFSWYRSGGYITDLKILHCPENPVSLNEEDLTRNFDPVKQVTGIPTLGGWNNYDVYYRRNYWNQGHQPSPEDSDDRNLCQPYPPADAVITWCPYHRREAAPAGPGVAGKVAPGDKDLVLFADGSVHRMTARQDNRMFEEPKSDTSWPAGPIM